jgi:hypothetical protein
LKEDLIGTRLVTNKALKLGRGQKAPYETTHYRIPKPIKPLVERIAEEYKQCLFAGGDEQEFLKKMSQSLEEEKPAQDVKELKKEIVQLSRFLSGERQRADEAVAEGLRAATILKEALKLKPQAGGAIKQEIRKALQLIDDI